MGWSAVSLPLGDWKKALYYIIDMLLIILDVSDLGQSI